MQVSFGQSNINGYAGGSSEHIRSLSDEERGVVLSLPFEVSREGSAPVSGATSPSSLKSGTSLSGFKYAANTPFTRTILSGKLLGKEVDHTSFMYAMTYFDRVVLAMPVHPVVGATYGTVSDVQRQFMNLEGVEVMPLFPEGIVDAINSDASGNAFFGPNALASFQSGCRIAFKDLGARDNGGWEISNGAYGLTLGGSRDKKSGLILKIFNRLPVVTEVGDPEHFLKWKQETGQARSSLRNELDKFVATIEVSSAEDIENQAREIAKICDELVALSQERFPRVRLLPIRLHYNREKGTSYGQSGGVAGGVLGGIFGHPNEGATVGAAIGAIAGLSFEGGPTLNANLIKRSPYASVVDLQYAANT